MRSAAFLMVAALVASAPTPAVAQTPPVVVVTEAPSAHFARVLLDKSGLVPLMVGEMKATLVPKLRAQLDGAGGLSNEQRSARAALLDRLPVLFDEESRAALPAAITALAQNISAQFSPDEAESAAAFFDSPVGSGFLQRMMGAAVSSAARGEDSQKAFQQFMATLTPEESQSLLQFMASPAGQAFGRNSKAFGPAIKTALRDVLGPSVIAGLQRRVCAEQPQASPACPKAN